MTESYFRLYRSQPSYRWWRPLLALLLAAVLIVSVSTGVILVVLLAQLVVSELTSTPLSAEALVELDVANPLSVLIALGSVAIWIPLIFLTLWTVGIKPVGMLNSVAFRLRWRRLAQYAIAAAVLVLSAQVISVLLLFLLGQASAELFPLDPVVTLLSLLIVLLIVPFQAAAEEYAFRGIFAQSLGSSVRGPLIPILIPSVTFMLLHVYDIWGMLEVLLLGLTAGWLTYTTGGLEAAIAIHVVNNVVVFTVLLSGVLGTTAVNPDAGSPVSLATTALLLGLYVLWVRRIHAQRELAEQ